MRCSITLGQEVITDSGQRAFSAYTQSDSPVRSSLQWVLSPSFDAPPSVSQETVGNEEKGKRRVDMWPQRVKLVLIPSVELVKVQTAFFLNLSPHSFNQETLAIRQLVIPTSVISPFIKGKGNLGSLGLDSCQNRGWENNGGSWARISFPESFIRKQTLSAIRLNKPTERPIFCAFSLEW